MPINPLKSQIAANRERFNEEFTENGSGKHWKFLPITVYDVSSQIDTFNTSLLQTAIDEVEGMKVKLPKLNHKQLNDEVYYERVELRAEIKRTNKALSKVVELLKGGIEGN